jgi:hypothetical protein
MNPNQIRNSRCRLLGGAAFAFAATLSSLVAQTTPASTESTATDDELLTLSPFTVTDDGNTGYRATSTLAGTRLKTDLRDVGSAITVITDQFLKDTGVKNTSELFLYTPSTEAGGLNGNFSGTTRVRGLGAADNARDFFLSDIPWDAYNVSRIDLQRGPNSILFGLGKPSGLVNASVKTAGYQNEGEIEVRADNFGSYRGVLNLNRVLLENELAVRFDALKDRTQYRQDPAYSDNERVFGALRYDPKFLARGSARTTFRANYEHGTGRGNAPLTTPPIDAISPWFKTGTTTTPDGRVFNNLNQGVFDWRYNTVYMPGVPNSGQKVVGSPNYQPGLGDLYGGIYAIFGDASKPGTTGNYYVPQSLFTEVNGIGPNGTVDRNVGGLFSDRRANTVARTYEIALAQGLPFASDYKDTSLTDPSVFDFYNKQLYGANNLQTQDFEAFNLVLSQTFLNNRLGLEAIVDQQSYENASYGIAPGAGAIITVDTNTLLPDQTPNPNVGRPMMVSRGYYGGGGGQTERENRRLTGFAEFRATDVLEKSWLTRVIGRHVFTGVLSEEDYDHNNQAWGSSAIVNGSAALLANALTPYRELQYMAYLGPDARGKPLSGLNLSNLPAMFNPGAGNLTGFNSTWNRPINPATAGYVDPAAPWVNPFNNQVLTQSENPANYIGWTNTPVTVYNSMQGDVRALTHTAYLNRDEVRSQVLVWQGFMFDGLVVPTFGYRKDKAKAYTAVAPTGTDGIAQQEAPSFVLPSTPYNEVSGTSKTYSLVVHTPQFIRKHLPYGLNFSLFYNESSNFEPAAGRVDILGAPLPPPSGETKDYGFVVSALDDRVVVKVNRFEAAAKSASYDLTNLWLAGALESRAWTLAKRYQAGLTGDPIYAGPNYNYGTMVNGVFVQTDADRTLQKQHSDAILAAFDQKIWTAWKMEANDYRWQIGAFDPWAGGLTGIYPAGMTTTTDTSSEGYEVETTIQPVKNWDITFNVSKVTASRANTAGGSTAEWIDARNAVFNGVGGDIRRYTGTATTTIGQQWNESFYNNYKLQQLLNGASAGEIRPWRFNFVTNYRFAGQFLKGFNVGGAYRWEDEVTIGYPSVRINVNGAMLNSYDINNPFHGPSESSVDLWTGYERKLRGDLAWRLQLNVTNAFGKNELIPINRQPDGTPAQYRIKQGPTWTITSSLKF